MSGIIFRKYQIGDEKGLTLLANAVWGSEFSEDYWRWKYLNNPVRDNYSSVAEFENEIVGFVGYIPWRMTVMGKQVIAGQYTDMMVHPEWRKKNIFFPLNRRSTVEVTEKAVFHFGFTNEASSQIYKKRFKYGGFYPCKMQRIMNTKSIFKLGIKKIKSANFGVLIRCIPKILSATAVPPARNKAAQQNGCLIKRIQVFDARFDQLWERSCSSLATATIRDSEYLNWRYTQNPEYKYVILIAEREDQLIGFVVLRCERKEGIIRGMIIDILMDPEHEAATGNLLSESLIYFQEQLASIVTAWTVPQNSLYAHLRHKGFSAETAEKVPLMMKSLSPDIETNYLCDIGHWYLTMGDCEVF